MIFWHASQKVISQKKRIKADQTPPAQTTKVLFFLNTFTAENYCISVFIWVTWPYNTKVIACATKVRNNADNEIKLN